MLAWDMEAILPVSYTHLDVYKRQVYSAGVNLRKKPALSGYGPMHISSMGNSSARNAEPLTGGGRSRKGTPKVVRATRPGVARNAAREKPEMVV